VVYYVVTIAKRISNNSHTLNNHLRLINPKSDTDLTNDCEHDINTFLTIVVVLATLEKRCIAIKIRQAWS
jgi:hypothetical protein